MSIVITGVAGFVGSNLARKLAHSGKKLVGFDNLSLGRLRNIQDLTDSGALVFHELDLRDKTSLIAAFQDASRHEPVSEVWHLVANSDIAAGVADFEIDRQNTFETTINVLEVMRMCRIPVLAFASSSAIYGRQSRPISETVGPLLPISNYGAMKLASEAAISAASESFLDRTFIFRFPNVVGTPATHGVIYDFLRRLRNAPGELTVLGNGTQQKGYLHVEELVDAMCFVREQAQEKIAVYNIGADDEGASVRMIAEEAVAVVSPGAKIRFGEGDRGWVGDVPRFSYDVSKLRALGWQPRMTSTETIKRAIREIAGQPEL